MSRQVVYYFVRGVDCYRNRTLVEYWKTTVQRKTGRRMQPAMAEAQSGHEPTPLSCKAGTLCEFRRHGVNSIISARIFAAIFRRAGFDWADDSWARIGPRSTRQSNRMMQRWPQKNAGLRCTESGGRGVSLRIRTRQLLPCSGPLVRLERASERPVRNGATLRPAPRRPGSNS
jgi:hypothetical protein